MDAQKAVGDLFSLRMAHHMPRLSDHHNIDIAHWQDRAVLELKPAVQATLAEAYMPM